MIRRPTINEMCVVASWILLGLSAAIVGISSRGWLALLWALYGNRDWPLATDIYLSSIHWFYAVPVLSGLILWVIWRRGILERIAPLILICMHAACFLMLLLTILAAIQPFLITTIR